MILSIDLLTIASMKIGDRTGSMISGILLIAGTSIGAGMLALPIVAAPAGFLPALAVNAGCWLYMLATGLLFLEATLLMPDGANVLSIAQHFLGKWGKYLCGATFLFLYYCLMTAYLSGGAPLLQSLFPQSNSLILYAALTGVLVAVGTKVVDRINWILMIGLLLSYLVMISGGNYPFDQEFLSHKNWWLSLFAAPTLFSAFGFHNIVPTLSTYLHRDRVKLRWAIIIGTAIPFIIYVAWQWIIIGALPAETLIEAGEQGIPLGTLLQEVTGQNWMGRVVNAFSFFAIITSTLGVALSMVDFIGDGLQSDRTGYKRWLITSAVFIPPALIASSNPALFIIALGIAGGFGEALINGLFPIAAVWIARYKRHQTEEKQLFGGKTFLVILTAVTIAIIFIEAFQL